MTKRKDLITIKNPVQPTKDDDEEVHEHIMPIEALMSMMGGNNVQAQLEDKGILFIEDVITKDTISRATKKLMALHFNAQFTDQIQIILNSPGGYCDAGWAFIDLMGWCKNPITTIALGEICSMATSIFIAGDNRVMSTNCSAMIHQFSDYGEGSYGDLIAKNKFWEMEYSKDLAHLLRCSKYKNKEQIKKHILKDHDHWLSPQDMKKHGLCDVIFVPPARGKKPACK